MWRKELGRTPPTHEDDGCTDDDWYQSKRPQKMVDIHKDRARRVDDFLKRRSDQSAEKESPTANNGPDRLAHHAMIEVEGSCDDSDAVDCDCDSQTRLRALAEIPSLEWSDFNTDKRLDEPGNVPGGQGGRDRHEA